MNSFFFIVFIISHLLEWPSDTSDVSAMAEEFLNLHFFLFGRGRCFLLFGRGRGLRGASLQCC